MAILTYFNTYLDFGILIMHVQECFFLISIMFDMT